MADFTKAYRKMKSAEYSGKEYKFLHFLNDEKGYTCGGIYQGANPTALDWNLIDRVVKEVKNIKRVSVWLHYDRDMNMRIFNYFKKHYWDISRLDEIQHQKVAEEIFMASVLFNPVRAVKMAQKIAQVKEDGILGKYSLKGINNVALRHFDEVYDILESKLAETVAYKYNKEHYLDGWKNRANDSWDIIL